MPDRASGNGQPDHGLPPRGTGRRRSLIFLVVLLLGLPLAFVVRSALDDGWREVAPVALLEEEGVLYIPEVNVFLVDADPPLALSGKSSHIGHRIAFCRQSQYFQEIHGGMWDRFGYYMNGPPTRGMDRVASRVVKGTVEIKVTRVTKGPPRGAGPPEPPSGLFCTYDDPSDPRAGFLDD
ncbi:MAG: hypothetical protein ACRDH9_10210 [Actinomycetota bacterium]